MRPMPAGEERTMCPKKATRVVLSRPISSRSLHLYVLFLSSIALLANNLPRSPTLPFRCRRYVLTETSTKKKFTHSAASVVTRRDLALESRRAARLAGESLRRNRSEAAARGTGPDQDYVARRRQNPTSAMVSASATAFNDFPITPIRPRRPLNRGQRSAPPVANRGTERSRTRGTVVDLAGSIRDFTAREATKRAGNTSASKVDEEFADGSEDEEIIPELPQFMSPEPITPDLASVLGKVPNLAPSHPSPLPTTQKKQSPEWLKCTYGGDYSKYQRDTQDYLRGARGAGHVYARIVLEHNGTLSQNSRKKLHWFIQWASRKPKPVSKA